MRRGRTRAINVHLKETWEKEGYRSPLGERVGEASGAGTKKEDAGNSN